MEQRALIDVICKAGMESLPSEIGALLGQDLICSDVKLDLITKETIFANPERAKTAFTRMTVGGDRDGNSYLMTSLSAAVILAGTLIMLPEDMIEENVQSGKLDGEISDAFGEVANIIAGVFTQVFVDKYPKTLRFIKTDVEELVPTKIDLDSDAPFPPGNFYVASCQMKLGEQDLGPMELVVPARVFELEDDPEAAAEAEAAPAEETAPASEEAPADTAPQAEDASAAPAEEAPAAEPAAPAKPPFADAKKLTDVVFNATIDQASEEVGALLGQTLTCDDVKLVMTSKADFFSSHCIDKSIMTHLKVTGDKEGLGYMMIQVPDAVILGGTLIMLPEDQIEEQKSGELEGEVADSFGEIANILAGSLTQVFLDRYPKQIRFVKTDTETIVPTKIDAASDAPFSEGDYYLASFAIHMEGFELNRIQLIFPAEIFDLDDTAPQEGESAPVAAAADSAQPADATAADGPAPGEWGGPPAQDEGSGAQAGQSQAAGGSAKSASDSGAPAASGAAAQSQEAPAKPTGPPIVLVISDQAQATEHLTGILTTAGYDCRPLSFQDEVKELFQSNHVLGIFLMMEQVGEKGFAAAIKLQAAGRPLPPIIFAGPEWTKSAVLKAVKYGAKDILITPASDDEIQNKLSLHIKKAS